MIEPIRPATPEEVPAGTSGLVMGTANKAIFKQVLVMELELDPALSASERGAFVWGVENCMRAMGVGSYLTPDESGVLKLKTL